MLQAPQCRPNTVRPFRGSAGSVTTTILMPQDAPLQKVEATRGYGGRIVTYDRYTQDREEIFSMFRRTSTHGSPVVADTWRT